MKKKLCLTALWVLATMSAGAAQGRQVEARAKASRPGNCETNSAHLDDVRNDVLRRADKNEVVVAVARLGDKEMSRTHNRRRLRAVRDYLVKYGVPAESVVTAEGERVKGYGRVELYVKGKLRTVLSANPNKALCVDCCEP